MTPRPLYRWTSFWLGLFVACFLVWAWWDSYRMGAGLLLGSGKGDSVVFLHGRASSYICLSRTRHADRFAWAYRTNLDPADVIGAWQAGGGTVHYLRIPDPAVFFTWLGLWGGGLAWHRRRMKQPAMTADA